MNNQTTLKIYYDGKLDYRATYVPLLKRRIKAGLIAGGNALCDKIEQLQNYGQ